MYNINYTFKKNRLEWFILNFDTNTLYYQTKSFNIIQLKSNLIIDYYIISMSENTTLRINIPRKAYR